LRQYTNSFTIRAGMNGVSPLTGGAGRWNSSWVSVGASVLPFTPKTSATPSNAKDDKAVRIFQRYSLDPFAAGMRRLFMSMTEIAKLFSLRLDERAQRRSRKI
jgi:hypothetical protein